MDRNMRTLTVCMSVTFGMLGLSYASVPFYRWFCQATGWDGTPRRAESAPGSEGLETRMVRVKFDANVAPGLDWDFRARTRYVDLKVGDTGIAYFDAKNTSDVGTRGHAAFNVLPEKAGKYFVKVACFCFNDQPLKKGEAKEMPVNFFIDPAILKDRLADDITEITLSYTFFPQDEKATAAADADEASTVKN